MLVFVLHFCFGLNFQCVLFWFFIFGIVNHIAILAMLVVTLYYNPSNIPFLFELYVDSKILWKFATKQPFMIYNLNRGINCPIVTWPFTFQFNKWPNNMWMILLFKACCKFGAHCLCHCATISFVTLDLKTTLMYSWKTCRSYYCLHNQNESITKWMEQLARRRGKRLCWSSQNPAIKHNRRLVFQRQCLISPLNVVVKELSLQSNHIWTTAFVKWYTWVQNIKTRKVKYAMGKMLDVGML
jgi:hypothetical protein